MVTRAESGRNRSVTARRLRATAPASAAPGPSRRAFTASFAAHVLILGVLAALPAGVARRTERTEPVDVVFFRPRVEAPQPVPQPVPPPARVEPPPKKTVVERPRPIPEPHPAPPPPRAERERRPEPPAAPPAIDPPRPQVRTNVLGDATPPRTAHKLSDA